MNETLAPHGLSVAQYAALLVLEEQPGTSVAEIARTVASTRQAANELIEGMERADLVQRRTHPSDRRRQAIHLTALGRRRLRAAHPDVAACEEALEAGLDPRARDAAREWLRRIAAHQ